MRIKHGLYNDRHSETEYHRLMFSDSNQQLYFYKYCSCLTQLKANQQKLIRLNTKSVILTTLSSDYRYNLFDYFRINIYCTPKLLLCGNWDALVGMSKILEKICCLPMPSVGSNRLVLLPCLELLWTNILSEVARIAASGRIEPVMATWKRRISRGLPAFFRQFWLHLRKNFR